MSKKKALPASKEKTALTNDSFVNFAARLGYNNGAGGGNQNALSYGGYEFNLLTRNRIKLEAMYRGSWVVGSMIDCIADDMTREGIELTDAETDVEGRILRLYREFNKLQIWQSINKEIKWSRLYGGAIGVLDIEGQDRSTPLDASTVGEGQFKGIIVYDRWQLNPDLFNVIENGPEMGLPKYYFITTDNNINDPANMDVTEFKVHHSRIIRMIGIELPFFQQITEMMWGESVLERVLDRLIAYDTTTMSAANLVNRASLRTVGIDGLREVIAAGGPEMEGLLAFFSMMREFQTNEGLTLLDKEDEFKTESYTFSGLDNVLLSFGQQVAGASETPLIRLLGEPPAGLGDTGESTMRNYHDSIKAKQEARLRNPLEVILDVMYPSVFGKPRPDTLAFKFKHLQQVSAMDKATVSKTNSETIVGAFEAGLTKKSTAMKELRAQGMENGIFTNISDEEIDEADEELPPMPEMGEQPDAGAEGKESVEKSDEEGKEKSPGKKFADWVRGKK